MQASWALIAVLAALPLVIAPAILLGKLLPNGAITVTSGAAVIAFTVLFAFLGGGYGLNAGPAQASIATPLDWLLGVILMLAAWTLAFADATQGRRWRWAIPLTVTAYLSFFAALALAAQPYPCPLTSTQVITPGGVECAPPNQTLQLLVLIGCFIGPLTAHLYSLRDTIPHKAARPDGLAVSPLNAEER